MHRLRKLISIQTGFLLLVSSLLFPLLAQGAGRTLIFQSEPDPSSPVYPAKQVKPQVSNSANAELFFVVQSLQKEVRELRGLIEEQGYQIRQLKKSGKDRYKDLDSRLLDLSKQNSQLKQDIQKNTKTVAKPQGGVLAVTESGMPSPNNKAAVVAVVPTKTEAVAAVEPSKEQEREYKAAYTLVKQRKFNEAADAFQAFVEKYPKGDLTANAYYWLGEVYLVLPKLDLAKQAFSIVVDSYPEHRKAPDALLKLGVTFQRLRQIDKAKGYFENVIKTFPKSTAAKLAKSYLGKI